MVFSLFDHPHFSPLLRHDEIDALFEAEAEISAMLRFEAALAEVEAELGVIPKEAGAAIVKAIRHFQPDHEVLARGMRRDGVIGPGLIESLRAAVPAEHRAHVHLGATSQDVVDTGLILRLKLILSTLRGDLAALLDQLDRLSSQQGTVQIMGRTRMQQALPIAFDDRIATWKSPLSREIDALDRLENDLFVVQFGGAVGTLDKLGEHGPAVRAALAERLGLGDPGSSWHAERGRIVDLATWLAKVSGSLGKIGQDLVLMAQNEVGEARLASSGSSSAMAHKRNPIQAEILIALARFNAGQIACLHHSLVHEGERSGAAWTLEWLVLPSMVATTAAALTISKDCLDGLTVNPSG